jgi:hypothetical protein
VKAFSHFSTILQESFVTVWIPSPFQGGPIDSETQGVALGWSAAALSAPESKISKFEFTNFDSWPFLRRPGSVEILDENVGFVRRAAPKL